MLGTFLRRSRSLVETTPADSAQGRHDKLSIGSFAALDAELDLFEETKTMLQQATTAATTAAAGATTAASATAATTGVF